jgi:hypothetical protein
MELSKQVQRHKDLTDKLSALVESRSEALPKKLAARFAARLEAGETMPDFSLVVRLCVRELAALQQEESASDLEATREAGDDPAVINAQEEARQAVYSEMTLLRSEVETGHGIMGVTALGMRGTTPTRAQDLETYAKSVLQNLQDEKISLGASRSQRMSFDRKGAANSIAPLVETLSAANKEHSKEAAELKVAQEKRTDAINTWKEEAPALGATLRSLFVLSGDTKGAERIVLDPYRRGKEEIEIIDETPAQE